MAEKKAEVSFKLPPVALWEHISKLALVEDKPIMTLYSKEINNATLVA